MNSILLNELNDVILNELAIGVIRSCSNETCASTVSELSLLMIRDKEFVHHATECSVKICMICLRNPI